jgi:molybdopterin converting factor small subunit
MKVQVRFFASLADLAGSSVETVEVAREADVETLWRLLGEMHPGIGASGYRPLVACDMEFSDWDRKLDGVKEVAFLPPVSGG